MKTARDVVSGYFADYRAEWSQPNFGTLFVPPPYFKKLETNRPCLLIGGRGTGKTTALRSLRFEETQARLMPVETPSESLPYFGIYVRINKNHARAFDAPEIDAGVRRRAFSHYFNLLVCIELCQLAAWLERESAIAQPLVLSSVCQSFGLQEELTASQLVLALKRELTRLEVYVNNPGRADAPVFSMAEGPVRTFAASLSSEQYLNDKHIFCCIDEYENLTEEQQSILNTYLKHCEPPLAYKVGMRRHGLHTTSTIDGEDQVRHPDDYTSIDIAEEGFDTFAEDVVEQRLRRARSEGAEVPTTIDEFLLELSFDEEAKLLGCERVAAEVLQRLRTECVECHEWAAAVPPSRLYFLAYWRESSRKPLCELARDWMASPKEWEVRLRNHGYASLFWLSRGRRGARIRKYYCGARTFLSMASGNIRYFLELIDASLQIPVDVIEGQASAAVLISPRAQTDAARIVGKRRLDQLEGVTERGVEIKRVVLALGKVFFELARDPTGRAPEQNSFVLSGSASGRDQIEMLLRDGVAHLAFEVMPRTKATNAAEMKDDEYRLHPIFCAFFEYSYRRKRRITVSADVLLQLAATPARAIEAMLDQGRQSEDAELPEQLAVFTDFFSAGR